MNTIPSIFNQHKIPYTILGGEERSRKVLMPVTCVVLSRNGKHFRTRVFENLIRKGFYKIINVNPKSESDNVASFARLFPIVKFIVALEDVSQGELLNLAFSEAETSHVLVLQEEMGADRVSFNAQMANRLMAKKQFCIAPFLVSKYSTRLPVVFSPSVKKSVFKVDVLPEPYFEDFTPTLYSADYAGFYDRERFMLLGGIDYTISSHYWQKIDFFFRSWLWGEKTSLFNGLEFSYSGDAPEENNTVDISYLRFYLKNLSPVFSQDHAHISSLSYFAFKLRNSCGFVESMRQFRDAVRWTEKNKYRFKTDAVSLIENWGNKVKES